MSEELVTKYSGHLGVFDRADVRAQASDLLALLPQRASGISNTLNAVSGSLASVICIDLAADLCGVSVNRKSAAKLSGAKTEKKYLGFVDNVKAALDLNAVPNVDKVTVLLGCPQLRSSATAALDRYKLDFMAGVTPSRRGQVSLDKAFLVCAAVSAVAKAEKVRLDKEKLLQLSGGQRPNQDKLTADMTAKLSTASRSATPTGKGGTPDKWATKTPSKDDRSPAKNVGLTPSSVTNGTPGRLGMAEKNYYSSCVAKEIFSRNQTPKSARTSPRKRTLNDENSSPDKRGASTPTRRSLFLPDEGSPQTSGHELRPLRIQVTRINGVNVYETVKLDSLEKMMESEACASPRRPDAMTPRSKRQRPADDEEEEDEDALLESYYVWKEEMLRKARNMAK